MTFRGWPAEALEFYEGLEADNTKAYWQDHKDDYERLVRAPMEELLAELEPEFGPGKLFRPYRDVRFSADKSPYKTNIGATVERGGYIQLSSEGLAAGCGYYVMDRGQLDRYRRAVAADRTGEELEGIVAKAAASGITITGHETLKTAPKGWPKDHHRIDLLRHKGLISWKEWPVAPWLGTNKAKDFVVEFFVASRPMVEWLDTNVGPGEG